MREHYGLGVLANLVSMMRADIDGAMLLADDESEARFYQRCVHRTACVVSAQEMALPLLEILEQRGIRGVVAAVRGVLPGGVKENVFRPSLGDVASILLASESCGRVIEDICGVAWLTACGKECGSIRARVVWTSGVTQIRP